MKKSKKLKQKLPTSGRLMMKGPWNKEPDRISWVDPETGYPCLLLRGPMGNWCGYVGVPPTHPMHGIQYGDKLEGMEYDADSLFDVHGGITFTNGCQGDPETGICHKPEEGEDNVWWWGFDTAHAWDWSPCLTMHLYDIEKLGVKADAPYRQAYKIKNAGRPRSWRERYRTARYTERHVLSLAKQLKQWEGKPRPVVVEPQKPLAQIVLEMRENMAKTEGGEGVVKAADAWLEHNSMED